jgi:hypothetical protein
MILRILFLTLMFNCSLCIAQIREEESIFVKIPESEYLAETSNSDESIDSVVGDWIKPKENTSVVKRSGDTLFIVTMSGKVVYYTDVKEDEASTNVIKYDYQGFINEINSHFISSSGYETYSCFLVDSETGDIEYVEGKPQFSYSGKYFVCVGEQLSDEGFDKNITIYKNTKGFNVVKSGSLTNCANVYIDWVGDKQIKISAEINTRNGIEKQFFKVEWN